MEDEEVIKLDYTLNTPEERRELVEKILAETPDVSPRYLEILADYLILCMEKQEKKDKKILTENRLSTINKRETSYEGLVSQFENGEDGIYDLISENNKNTIFKPKISITEDDIKDIPELKQGKEAIQYWEEKLKTATGKEAYAAKKAIIELRKDQYLIKDAYRKPVQTHKSGGFKGGSPLNGQITVRPDGTCVSTGVTFIDPAVISGILCNYTQLKDTAKNSSANSDLWCLMYDFDKLLDEVLINEPVYKTIVQGKFDGLQNQQIQKLIDGKHSAEYISNLWRNKIPEMIAAAAEEKYLDWYYLNVEKGKYKKCNRCGKTKLAHSKYFSKNKTSKDGWYSICKECRNNKGKKV